MIKLLWVKRVLLLSIVMQGNASLKQRLQTLMQQLHGTLFSALENYAHQLKNTPEKMNMPKDGTVHELTSNVRLLYDIDIQKV
jgi:hypothetical protein